MRHGSPADEAGHSSDENLHEVTLTQAFEMQATPVTQLQWAIVMEGNPSNFNSGGLTIKFKGKDISMNPNRPVELVSWDDVQRFIEKLNAKDPHYHYRLPHGSGVGVRRTCGNGNCVFLWKRSHGIWSAWMVCGELRGSAP